MYEKMTLHDVSMQPLNAFDLIKELKADVNLLKAKIAKAIVNLELVELGEGYELNLREILEDLKEVKK